MNQTYGKILFSLMLLGIVAVIGCYLSGFILLQWLDLNNTPLGLRTYFQYFSALDMPKVAKYANQIKVSGSIGFGLPFVAWLFLLILMFRQPEQSLHGEARFADGRDLAKANFFKPTDTSIVVGKHNG